MSWVIISSIFKKAARVNHNHDWLLQSEESYCVPGGQRKPTRSYHDSVCLHIRPFKIWGIGIFWFWFYFFVVFFFLLKRYEEELDPVWLSYCHADHTKPHALVIDGAYCTDGDRWGPLHRWGHWGLWPKPINIHHIIVTHFILIHDHQIYLLINYSSV